MLAAHRHLFRPAAFLLLIPLASCMGAAGEALTPELEPLPDDGKADSPGERVPHIVNGQTDHGHASVGLLQTAQGNLCTGTLIGKKVVLTAGHCGVIGGWSFGIGGKWVPVVSAAVHPSYNSGKTSNLTAEDASYDVAVLHLQYAPPVVPTPIASSFQPSVGQSITFVGYGITQSKGSGEGVKRKVQSHISKAGTRYLQYGGVQTGEPGGHCNGDSGGPTFVVVSGQEVQVGVISLGNCLSMGASSRIDAHIAWIKQQAGGDLVSTGVGASATPPSPPAASGGFGDACQQGSNCQTGLCAITTGGQTFCTQSCSAQSGCPGGATCYPTSYGFQVCGPPASAPTQPTPAPAQPTPPPVAGDYGAACQSGANCSTGLCAETDLRIFCTQSCSSSGDCPYGSDCYSTGAGQNICVPKTAMGSPPSGSCHAWNPCPFPYVCYAPAGYKWGICF